MADKLRDSPYVKTQISMYSSGNSVLKFGMMQKKSQLCAKAVMKRSTHNPSSHRDIAFVHEINRHDLMNANPKRNTAGIQKFTKVVVAGPCQSSCEEIFTYSGLATVKSKPMGSSIRMRSR
nr:hypothetical protein [Bifidobacterium catenulatum]